MGGRQVLNGFGVRGGQIRRVHDGVLGDIAGEMPYGGASVSGWIGIPQLSGWGLDNAEVR